MQNIPVSAMDAIEGLSTKSSIDNLCTKALGVIFSVMEGVGETTMDGLLISSCSNCWGPKGLIEKGP